MDCSRRGEIAEEGKGENRAYIEVQMRTKIGAEPLPHGLQKRLERLDAHSVYG